MRSFVVEICSDARRRDRIGKLVVHHVTGIATARLTGLGNSPERKRTVYSELDPELDRAQQHSN